MPFKESVRESGSNKELHSDPARVQRPLAEIHKDAAKGAIWELIEPFLQWAESVEYESFDWWDLWGTNCGCWAKKTYVRNKYLGTPAVALIAALDVVYPNFRRWVAEKRAYPICLAHVGLGYLNLWEVTGRREYLKQAEALVEPLLRMAAGEARGLGWGFKHNWATVQGVIPADTPCNTQTAYAYDLFAKLLKATGNHVYLEYLASIAAHVANDFPEWHEGEALVCAYSTIDKRKVVNANSYRMVMLLDAGIRFENQGYLDKGIATLRYVLAMQNADGSWPYSEDQSFVDTYHTCFVLKNLQRARSMLDVCQLKVNDSIRKGVQYYCEHLIDRQGHPIPFSVKPRLTLQKYDSYDLAESIGLLAELNIYPERLAHLLRFAKTTFQTDEGWFIFRVYSFWPSDGIPYMRHANTAMFLALTKALTIPSTRTIPMAELATMPYSRKVE